MTDAAQIIAAHQWHSKLWFCTCGWGVRYDDVKASVLEAHAAHVLAVLSETHAVLELPEPNGESYSWDGERHNVDVLEGGLVEVDVSVVDPVEARELAAHLFAAARVAEATQ
ncbi:hypothetical protein [Williamsia serinedens]|uniref:Uncharacterized protein n=1 Tax=Williamsia serinedens TaxID=391736 RepID=A0ABT1H610_9NOCA|nr:hypothetical protein [Williamsia serinedens]MCP2162681.1 hypothetical protein [Williamsia serinedens]